MAIDEDRVLALPCWNGGITIEPLKGGLSNESLLVTDAGGKHVVRFGSDFPFHHVFRDREIMVARAAHAAGFAPEVRYAQPGVMVTAYLGAKTCGAADVRGNRHGSRRWSATSINECRSMSPAPASCSGFSTSSATMRARSKPAAAA